MEAPENITRAETFAVILWAALQKYHRTMTLPKVYDLIDEMEANGCTISETEMCIRDRSMAAVPVMVWDPEQKCKVESGEYVFDSKGAERALESVSYTHLDVYKRQLLYSRPHRDELYPFPGVRLCERSG